MKVKELIAELKTHPQDADIFMSSDEEGNSFHNTDGVWETGHKDKTSLVIFPKHDFVELD